MSRRIDWYVVGLGAGMAISATVGLIFFIPLVVLAALFGLILLAYRFQQFDERRERGPDLVQGDENEAPPLSVCPVCESLTRPTRHVEMVEPDGTRHQLATDFRCPQRCDLTMDPARYSRLVQIYERKHPPRPA